VRKISVKTGAVSSWQYIVENSREDPPTSVRFRLPGFVVGASPVTIKFNNKQVRGLSAPGATDGRAVQNVQTSKHEFDWSVNYVPAKRISVPKYHFMHFVGMAMNNTSSTADAGAWTFGTNITTALRYFTLFKEIDNLQHQVSGCQIGRLTVKGSVDTPVEIEASGPGSLSTFADLARTDATSLRDATPYWFSDVQVYIDGALATFVTAFEFNINNAAEAIHSLGDKNPQQVITPTRTLDVTLTRQYQDVAQAADGKNNVAKSITIRLNDTSGDSVDFRFRGCKLAEHPVPDAPPEASLLVHQLKYDARELGAD